MHKEAHKEIVLPFESIKDPQKITDVQEEAFKKSGLDMHRDELIHEEIIDDHDKQARILKVRARKKYFFMGT